MPAPKGHAPYPGCEKGGRPKKYTTEYIENEADEFEKWMLKKDSIWYEGFAVERGYHPEQLALFAKENEKFSAVYKKSQGWQKNKLISSGLLGKFNANITKLVLANTCGWTDKVESKISGDADNPVVAVYNYVNGSSRDLIDGEAEE